jgi:hypothetical protein
MYHWGPKRGRFVSSGGREYAAISCESPSAPGGSTGRVKEKGIARTGTASVGRGRGSAARLHHAGPTAEQFRHPGRPHTFAEAMTRDLCYTRIQLSTYPRMPLQWHTLTVAHNGNVLGLWPHHVTIMYAYESIPLHLDTLVLLSSHTLLLLPSDTMPMVRHGNGLMA